MENPSSMFKSSEFNAIALEPNSMRLEPDLNRVLEATFWLAIATFYGPLNFKFAPKRYSSLASLLLCVPSSMLLQAVCPFTLYLVFFSRVYGARIYWEFSNILLRLHTTVRLHGVVRMLPMFFLFIRLHWAQCTMHVNATLLYPLEPLACLFVALQTVSTTMLTDSLCDFASRTAKWKKKLHLIYPLFWFVSFH